MGTPAHLQTFAAPGTDHGHFSQSRCATRLAGRPSWVRSELPACLYARASGSLQALPSSRARSPSSAECSPGSSEGCTRGETSGELGEVSAEPGEHVGWVGGEVGRAGGGVSGAGGGVRRAGGGVLRAGGRDSGMGSAPRVRTKTSKIAAFGPFWCRHGRFYCAAYQIVSTG
jgi:hypothetical protein